MSRKGLWAPKTERTPLTLDKHGFEVLGVHFYADFFG